MNKFKFLFFDLILILLVLISLLSSSSSSSSSSSNSLKCFPNDFIFGTATAAIQIEGAYKTDGKELSIWDVFSHNGNHTYHNENPDIADDHYNRLESDTQLMKSLKLKNYRFSIAWTRIINYEIKTVLNLNKKTKKFEKKQILIRKINYEGINHYLKELKILKLNGIEPYVTLYHWDLPQKLFQVYDWRNKKIIDEFVFYSKICFQNFGKYVNNWITFNEPFSFVYEGYFRGNKAPARIQYKEYEPYLVAHNVLLSHSKTVQLFREKFQIKNNKNQIINKIGATLSGFWAESKSNLKKDIEAAERYRLFQIGWFADPIVFGDYPKEMKQFVGNRLPNFTIQEKKLLKNSFDYFLFNHYTTRYIEFQNSTKLGWDFDVKAKTSVEKNGILIGKQAKSKWLYMVPWGFRKVLNWIQNRYNPESIIITENGVSCPNENKFKDDFRIEYLHGYISELWKAMKYDNVNVKGYFLWSLLDNFEWEHGYSERFGIHHVDYENNLERTNKLSSYWYSNLITSKCIPDKN